MQVGGVHSGTVRSILLPHKPGEKVTVIMDLDKSTHEIIKQDSVASIETEGLLGNQFVAISFGSDGQAEVKNGDTIQRCTATADGGHAQEGERAFWIAASRLCINTTEATAHLNSISAKIDSGAGNCGSAGERQGAL